MHDKPWYEVDTIHEIDSPSLVVYSQRLDENINILKSFLPDVDRVRPHVKTHKSSAVTERLLKAGIYKFKCATIAEAEMLALAGAPDILLAYQPAGPKINRLIALIANYPKSIFSCLVDTIVAARAINTACITSTITLNIFIDLNVGMNRTGILAEHAENLYDQCSTLSNINVIGLHAYDGHLRDPDLAVRTKACDEAFEKVISLKNRLEKKHTRNFTIVAGGTPTFPIHARRDTVECSPGTFIYWDKGYQTQLPEQPFLLAALVITRIISKPDEETICTDLGHKSIASENTIDKRVYFLNAPDLQPVGHSEEHLVLKAPKKNSYAVGDVLYGIPHHICPTVALHDIAHVVANHHITEKWNTVSRNRKITI